MGRKKSHPLNDSGCGNNCAKTCGHILPFDWLTTSNTEFQVTTIITFLLRNHVSPAVVQCRIAPPNMKPLKHCGLGKGGEPLFSPMDVAPFIFPRGPYHPLNSLHLGSPYSKETQPKSVTTAKSRWIESDKSSRLSGVCTGISGPQRHVRVNGVAGHGTSVTSEHVTSILTTRNSAGCFLFM